MFQHDHGHTGQSPFIGPLGAEVVNRCSLTLGGAIPGSPAVAGDGTIYVPAGGIPSGPSDQLTGFLFALNPDCTQKWSYTLPGPPVPSLPAIASDGTVFVHANGKANLAAVETITAVNPDGTKKWVFEFNGGAGIFVASVQSSPAIADDGTIWIGSIDTRLYGLHTDGTLKCSASPTRSSISSSPAIGADGTIYVIDDSSQLYAYDQNCSKKWTMRPSSPGGTGNDQSPAVSPGGTIYTGFAFDNQLYAVNSDGSIKWTFPTANGLVSTPAIAPDGTVYIAADGLYAVNSDGSLKWKGVCSGDFHGSSASPLIGNDGTVYFWEEGLSRQVCAFRSTGEKLWSIPMKSQPSGFLASSFALGSNGDLLLSEGETPPRRSQRSSGR